MKEHYIKVSEINNAGHLIFINHITKIKTGKQEEVVIFTSDGSSVIVRGNFDEIKQLIDNALGLR